MNKKFLLGGLLVLVLGGVAALVAHKFNDVERIGSVEMAEKDIAAAMQKKFGVSPTQAVSSAQTPIEMSRPLRLAIGGLGFGNDEKDRSVADLTLANLGGAAGLDLVERQSLDAVLRELNLSASGLVRAKHAVRVGKLVRADWFLLGSLFVMNGTNSIVVRVVDARTGIMVEAGVFSGEQLVSEIAKNLASFVRQCREDAAQAKARVYLAFGTFRDLSVNNRLADFPPQLRAYLTAAYQGNKVTLLEREFVSTLLQEVRLDLAGLTDTAGTNASSPMQSAFWLVDGYYQSYETTDQQVELVLNVQRMLGRNQQTMLRAKPGEILFKQVKDAVDEVMKHGDAVLFPTRMTELKAQLNSGRDLLEAVVATKGYNHGYDWIGFNGELSEREVARLRRNTEEAIRAFETALLLDPQNREAKFQLATCFQKPFIHRVDEARELYREIIEESVDDRWTGVAQTELVWGLEERSGAEEAARWFQSALARNTNKSRTEFFRQHAETAANAVIIQRGDSPKATELAQKRLLERIRLNREFIKNNSGSFHPDYGMDDFAEAFKNDKGATARALVEFLPKMKVEYPDMIPYLLASVLDSQSDPNGIIAVEFGRVLDDCIANPERVFKVQKFWQDVRWSVYGWCFAKTNYPLAVKLMEGERRAAAEGHASDFNDQEKIKLAYAYMAVERWKDALETFESFSNRQFRAEGGGPWGKAFVPILTGKLADDCRGKLGLSVSSDSRKFEIGPEIVCLHTASEFACDAEGLWIAIAGQLIQCSFDLRTNLVVSLPIDPGTPISCLSVGTQKIWIGTSGEGLVEFDKTSRTCRRFTEADGLLMDDLASLHLSGDFLWIGYGGKNGGGLGRFDFRSQKFKSYMASLNPGADESPPKTAVGQIATVRGEDVWMVALGVVRQLRTPDDSWQTIPSKAGHYATCLSGDSERIVEGVGIGQNINPKGGLEIFNLPDNKWQSFADADGLPNPPTAMLVDGQELWVGGQGFITFVDLKERKVRKFSHIRTRSVDRIQVGGGYVWVKYDKHLHRAALRELR